MQGAIVINHQDSINVGALRACRIPSLSIHAALALEDQDRALLVIGMFFK
jgi:hypothetical protein